jgi:NitT/TauT family transport system permease protein
MSIASSKLGVRIERWVRTRIPTVVAGVVFLLVWAILGRVIDSNRIFATVSYTQSSLIENSNTVFIRIVETFTSIVVAFTLAAVFGILIGIVIAEIFVIRQMTMPLVIFGYSIPHPVLAPVFVIWFLTGNDITLLSFTGPSAYLLADVTAQQAQQSFAINGVTTFGAWVGFFPVFISTITGMNSLEERYKHFGQVLGATRWQMVKYFRFWQALPNIVSSLKATVQLSIVGVIVAEFVASSAGIGYQIVLAWKRAELGYMFGVIIVIMVGSYLFYQFVVWLIKILTPPTSA